MIPLRNYTAHTPIYQGQRFRVYRGWRDSDRAPVIIKTNAHNRPSLRERASLKQEYELGARLRIPGVMRYLALESAGNGFALIMEDCADISLAEFLQARPLPVDQFVPLALVLAATLEAIHGQGIIHRDLEPHNILLQPDGSAPKVIDFGAASLLGSERQDITSARLLEGSLSYISPEQTGRLHHSIDHRSDLYSLGVCFYEMLTGRPPFQASDPLEMTFLHLARMPEPPAQLVPNIPPALSKMVMRLLAKMPEERYQSARAVLGALERVRAAIAGTGGQALNLSERLHDGERFQVSQQLYGRAAEVERLLSAFTRAVCGRSELLLVRGYSGIGKSSLVYQIQKPIVASRAMFAAGKFEQYRRDIPYYSLVPALRDVLRQILAEEQERLAEWRQRLADALGTSGHIITDLLPELELLVGPRPGLPVASGTDAQRRFTDAFQRFVRALAAPEHPLVIFLDDLQWADPGTLALLHTLTTDSQSRGLLIIGAYRDNEVGPMHPLTVMLDQARASGAVVSELYLQPLDLDSIAELVTDTLRCDADEGKPLTELLLRKTQGNPFFINQLLIASYQEQLIRYDSEAGAWRWDVAAIERHHGGYDILELVLGRLHKLGPATLRVLQLAACLGSSFDLETLALVSEQSLRQTATDLWPALEQELLLPASDSYKLPMLFDLDAESEELCWMAETAAYKFLHDRVQQAAYSLIAEDERTSVHLRIARLLVPGAGQEQLEQRLFDIVAHYQAAWSLVVELDERCRLAELELLASRKAKANASFATARELAAAAVQHLPASCWQDQPVLALACYLELGEAELLNGRYAKALEVLAVADGHADGTLDRCKLCELKVMVYKMRNELGAAFETGARMLAALDVHIERDPPLDSLQAEESLTRAMLSTRRLEHLHEEEETTEPETIAACRILQELWPVAFFLGSQSMHVVAMKLVQLSLSRGVCRTSGFGYMAFSFAQVHCFDDIEEGYRLGLASLKLHERFQTRELAAKIFNIWGALIQHYKEPLAGAKETLLAGLTGGLEVGDYQWAGYCAMNYTHGCIFGNTSLADAITHLERVMPVLRRYDPIMTNHAVIMREACASLCEGKAEPARLLGQWCNEYAIRSYVIEKNESTTHFFLYAFKLSLALFFGHNDNVLSWEADAESCIGGSVGVWLYPVFLYHQGLVILGIIDQIPADAQPMYLARVRRNYDKLQRWSRYMPANFEHMCLLLEAEQARVDGRTDAAMGLYECAAESARASGFVQYQGLACELAAQFHRARGSARAADMYIEEACYCYELWGARAKVAQLMARYPHLAEDGSARQAVAAASGPTVAEQLDVFAVVKASQAISRELVLDSLARALLRVLVESAGAERGFLILPGSGSELMIEAAMPAHLLEQPEPVVSSNLVPRQLIQYVVNTRAMLRSDHTGAADSVGFDPYIARNRPRSFLCVPILRSDVLLGLLYLENSLVAGVFSAQKLEMLQVLAAQAAVSLENARLYDRLEQRVEERTRELRAAHDELARVAHRAGMAEVAANVLHNAGNYLNSVLVSISMLDRDLEQFSAERLSKIVTFLRQPADSVAALMASDRGHLLIGYLDELAQVQSAWHAGMAKELAGLRANAERLERIIAQQRAFVSDARLVEMVDLVAEIGDVLDLHAMDISRLGIEVQRQYDGPARLPAERHKLHQVLTNVIHNAVQALAASAGPRVLTIRALQPDPQRVHIEIRDNGVGIPAEQLDSIFVNGYSTRMGGLGYGLHYCATTLQEMGGGLRAYSAGEGKGATLTVVLPSGPPAETPLVQRGAPD